MIRLKRIFLSFLCLAVVLSCFAFPAFAEENGAKSNYSLSFLPDCSFCVLDKNGNTVWNSTVTEEIYSEINQSAAVWQAYMHSIVKISYADKTNIRDNIIDAYSAEKDNVQKLVKKGNKTTVSVEFTQAKISLSVEITLENDGFSVNIPYSSISENGNYYLRSVELFPFFGAADGNQDGYIFYPEGNGAICRFDKTDAKHSYTKALSLPIYSSNVLEELIDSKEASAMLPVYGIKRNNHAFLAAITSDEASAQVEVNADVGNAAVHLNYACFKLIYRDTYRIYLSNITANGKNTAQNLYGSKADAKMIKGDRTVRFFLLEDADANYSGMANRYRKYLCDEKLINSESKAQNAVIDISFLMSVKEKSGFIRRTVAATTFKDLSDILEDYRKSGVDNINVTLKGWSKGGYNSDSLNFAPEGAVGGKRGLKKLKGNLKSFKNLNVFLDNSILLTSKKSGVVYSGSSVPVTDITENIFLRSPVKITSVIKKITKSTNKYGFGTAYDNLGDMLYRDYKKKSSISRKDAVQMYLKTLSKEKEPLSVEGGNLYMLSVADSLSGIPTDAAGNQLSDESVPFFSMVVHGILPFTCEAVNCAYDTDECILKSIEYGSVPHFELTKISPTELKNTAYTSLFSSENSKWKKRVVETYKVFDEELSGILNSYMISHIRNGNTVKIEYSNNKTVYLNYGSTPAEIDGITVKAMGYFVTEARE